MSSDDEAIVELPDGTYVNAIHIQEISKHQHFFGRKYYVRIKLRSGEIKDVDEKSEDECESIIRKLRDSANYFSDIGEHYDSVWNAANSDGWESGDRDGYRRGFSCGYEDARAALFRPVEEEGEPVPEAYGIGRHEGYEEGCDQGYRDGVVSGRYEALSEASLTVQSVTDEIIDRIRATHGTEQTPQEVAVRSMGNILARRLSRMADHE